MLADGATNHEIADHLHISPNTVQTYRQRIMRKLDLHCKTELLKYALRKRFIGLEALSARDTSSPVSPLCWDGSDSCSLEWRDTTRLSNRHAMIGRASAPLPRPVIRRSFGYPRLVGELASLAHSLSRLDPSQVRPATSATNDMSMLMGRPCRGAVHTPPPSSESS